MTPDERNIEVESLRRVCDAQKALLDAMDFEELDKITPLEWSMALNQVQRIMLGKELRAMRLTGCPGK